MVAPNFVPRSLALLLALTAFVACVDSEPLVPAGDHAASDQSLHARGGPSSDGLVAIDLGTLGGATTTALGISDRGHVAGWSTNANGVRRPFIWTAEEGMRDLGTLGGESGVALDVNQHGTAVGWSDDATGNQLPTMWTPDGEIVRLAPHAHIGEPDWPSVATAINRHGEIVGYTHGTFMARWTPSGEPVGIPCSGGYPSDISDRGVVVGVASGVVGAFLVEVAGPVWEYSGFRWDGRECEGLIGDELVAHDAVAVNSRGEILGLGAVWEPMEPPISHLIWVTEMNIPFIFSDGAFVPSDDLPAEPRDMNDRGVVVGDGFEAVNNHGDRISGRYLWTSRPQPYVARGAVIDGEATGPGSTESVSSAVAMSMPTPSAPSSGASGCPPSVQHLVEIGALPSCPFDRGPLD